MSQEPDKTAKALINQLALSTWDGEGGAGPDGPQDGSRPHERDWRERRQRYLLDDVLEKRCPGLDPNV